jgi:tetratricopeptide (TPR) repeat protein
VVTATRKRIKVDDSALALRVGEKIKAARLKAGLTQQQLADGRYTKAYISALEHGHSKPSMAALNFISERLGVPASQFIATDEQSHQRLEADLLLASGSWQEALDAYELLLESTTDRATRAEILRSQAEALCRMGRGFDAIRPATEALNLFDSLGDPREALMAGYWLANAQYFAENIAEARSVLRMLLDRVRSGIPVDPDFQIRLLTGASTVETWDGNHQAAVAYLEEARGISADMDDRRRASFLAALANAYYDRGDIEGSIRAGNQSLALFRSAEAKYESALIENNLANSYLALGNLTRASELATQAHREHEFGGDERQLANVLDTEARIQLAGGNVKEAVALSQKAIAAALDVGNQKAWTDATLTMARAALKSGKTEEALAMYERVATSLRAEGPRSRLAEVLTEWAETVAAAGDHQRAYQLTKEALGERSSH